MVEFKGYISGAAEKHFYKKTTNLGQNLMLAGVLFLLPLIAYFSFRIRKNNLN